MSLAALHLAVRGPPQHQRERRNREERANHDDPYRNVVAVARRVCQSVCEKRADPFAGGDGVGAEMVRCHGE